MEAIKVMHDKVKLVKKRLVEKIITFLILQFSVFLFAVVKAYMRINDRVKEKCAFLMLFIIAVLYFDTAV